MGCSSSTETPRPPWTNPVRTYCPCPFFPPLPKPKSMFTPQPHHPLSTSRVLAAVALSVHIVLLWKCFVSDLKDKPPHYVVLFNASYPQEALSLFAVSWTVVQVECRLALFCFPSWFSAPLWLWKAVCTNILLCGPCLKRWTWTWLTNLTKQQ